MIDDHVLVSVDLSFPSLRSPELTDALGRALADAGLPSQCLSLEVTEASLERDPTFAATLLEDLARLGVRLCLDDYGPERSTIGALSSHPFGTVKVGAATGARTFTTVLGAARAAGLETVAERIETDEQLEAVRNLGCDAAQGFLFAALGPAPAVGRWLDSRKG